MCLVTLVNLFDRESAVPQSEWSIAEAKSKLSEVLSLAEHRAQVITRRDRRYVVIDDAVYQRLQGTVPSLKDLILSGPGLDGVDLRRDRSPGRESGL